MSNYNQESIKSLKNEERVRQRPAVIFGTNDENGAAHAIMEIVSNSVDEWRESKTGDIELSMYEDGVVVVQDYGRGVPMGYNEKEGKYNWELIYCDLYASGKYDNSNYKESLGTNGLGCTATQYASEYMIVTSVRSGIASTVKFKAGIPITDIIKEETDKPNGTRVEFKMDSSVFIGIEEEGKYSIKDAEFFLEKLRKIAVQHDGLKVTLDHYSIEGIVELEYEGGARGFLELVKHKVSEVISIKGSEIGKDRDEEYKVDMSADIVFSKDTSFIEMYHNGGFLSGGGCTQDAIKRELLKVFNTKVKNQKSKITWSDVEGIVAIIGSTGCPGHLSFYKNQTKEAINNPFIGDSFGRMVRNNMADWINTDESKEVVRLVLLNKQAREAASLVSKKVVRELNKKSSATTMGQKPKNLIGCRSKVMEEKELYIVEGESALGAVKLARNAKTQAIMAIIGKIINAMKESLERVLSSKPVIDLIKVIGCGVSAKSKYIKDLKCDMSRLNFGKIIICTDADVDGSQIRCLILGLLWVLVPELIKEGRVYIAESPLFQVEAGGRSAFAYTEQQKDFIVGKLSEVIDISKIKISRSKGLGENTPQMMKETTMDPRTRKLIRVVIEDDSPTYYSELDKTLNELLGTDLTGRKRAIKEYSDKIRVQDIVDVEEGELKGRESADMESIEESIEESYA